MRKNKIQLKEIELNHNISEEVQLLRVSTIFDPRYGKVVISKKMLKEMIKNFYDKVRGIDLMIDYGHDTEKEAAGWIKDLYLNDDETELWAKVVWTSLAEEAIKDKRYRYISADFDKDYKDNETLEKFGTVLKGAALTNRPVVKRMKPTIELGEKKMNVLETLMEVLEVTDETKLTEKIEEMLKNEKTLSEKLSELEKKLADKDDQVSKLSDEEKRSEKLEAKIEELENKLELNEKNSKFNVMLAEGKVVEAQRKFFISGDMIKFAENAGKINLSEKGHGRQGSDTIEEEDTFENKVIALAEKKIKNKEFDNIVDAQEAAMKELR